eukprot:6138007-Pyramimonas_sp.AAC.2
MEEVHPRLLVCRVMNPVVERRVALKLDALGGSECWWSCERSVLIPPRATVPRQGAFEGPLPVQTALSLLVRSAPLGCASWWTASPEGCRWSAPLLPGPYEARVPVAARAVIYLVSHSKYTERICPRYQGPNATTTAIIAPT